MRRLREEKGAVAVEFAIVVPVLLLLLVGIIEYSLALNTQISLTSAAREGARSMALHKTVTTAKSDVKNAFFLSPALTDAEITVSPATCVVGTLTTTTIRYPYHFITGLFGDQITLTGKAAMRCGG